MWPIKYRVQSYLFSVDELNIYFINILGPILRLLLKITKIDLSFHPIGCQWDSCIKKLN